MENTTVQKIIAHYKNSRSVVVTTESVAKFIENYLDTEREQIESAVSFGKQNPNEDAGKYYFMNYISND